jgi:hypothetical protein
VVLVVQQVLALQSVQQLAATQRSVQRLVLVMMLVVRARLGTSLQLVQASSPHGLPLVVALAAIVRVVARVDQGGQCSTYHNP